ncbi:MAG: YdeI/OmpD-associated family protein, partial [Myxococcales bacterium]
MKKPLAPKPVYFATPAEWRAWLQRHHAVATDVWVGYHKRGTGEPSLTWPESVDEALCFGWIDGVRKSVDERRYTIRFTPRKARSTWSAVNIARVAELEAEGRMTDAGRA